MALVFGLFAYANVGFCSGVITPTSPSNPLVTILSPFVRTLGHSVWVYHWVDREDYRVAKIPATGPVSSDTDMKPYIKLVVSLFENTSFTQNGNMGNGLYLATDPVSSGMDSEFGLLQITFPKGMRYLNYQALLESLPASTFTSIFSTTSCNVDYIFNSKGNCRKLLVQALKALKVDAVSYEYPVEKPLACDHLISAAFIVTGAAIENARTHFFVAEVPANEIHTLDRLFINTYARKTEANRLFSPIWETRDLMEEPVGYDDYLKENLFGCSSKYSEDGK